MCTQVFANQCIDCTVVLFALASIDSRLVNDSMAPPNKAAPTGTPASDFQIGASLVRALLEQQHPDLACLPIQSLDAGWDNAMFRLGKQYCVRLPRREAAAALIEHEQTWLPRLAPQLSLPIPSPCR